MKKTGFVFPGQGSQYVGMGRDIYDNYKVAKDTFDKASDALDFDLKTLCFQGPEDKLGLTTYTQPAILATSLAIWSCIKNPHPFLLSGHSLGEFTALVIGGAIDLETAVKLVRERGRLMQESVSENTGAMAAIIGLENKEVQGICEDSSDIAPVWPANYNCPGQIVISGLKKGVMYAIELAKQKGAKRAVILPVSIPSHCPLMQGAAERFSERVKGIEMNDLQIPVISNCRAEILKEREGIRANMIEQLIRPVRWEDCIRFMIKEGITTFIEVGPGRVLTGLIKRIHKQAEVMNIYDIKSLQAFMEAFS